MTEPELGKLGHPILSGVFIDVVITALAWSCEGDADIFAFLKCRHEVRDEPFLYVLDEFR